MTAMPTVYFHEDQRFRDSRLWLIVLVPFVVAVAVSLAVPNTPTVAALVPFVIGIAIVLLFVLARLETKVTDQAVVVAFHGVWPTRRIPLDQVAGFEARRYSMWDSGGWGVHLGLAGMTYNVRGNQGVRFRLKNGSAVLVGTQRPEEFAAAIAKAMDARGAR